MAYFNQTSCQRRRGNTGLGRCDSQHGPVRGLFLAPKGDGINAAGAADLQTFLRGRLQNPVYAQRWHFFGPFVEIANNDAEASTTEYQDGSQYTNRQGYYRTGYRTRNGNCAHAAYRRFADRQDEFDVIEVEETESGWKLATIEGTDANGAPLLVGQSASRIDVPNLMKATFGDAPATWINIDFANAEEYNENYSPVAVQTKSGKNFDPVAFAQNNAVKDVSIQQVSAALVNGVATIYFGGTCGNVAVAQTITAALLNAFNAQTGAAITITSLTAVPGNGTGNTAGQYVLTLDTTDTDYPTTGGQIRVSLKDVATVFTAIAAPYESNELVLTV